MADVGRHWFDAKTPEEEQAILSKCKEVWAIGGTDNEASFYAEITAQSLSRYLHQHPDVAEFRERLREKPILKARTTVVGALDDPEMAFRYLERKAKKEFAVRQENTGPNGEPLILNIVQYGNTDSLQLASGAAPTPSPTIPSEVQGAELASQISQNDPSPE